jgi:heme oxygenase
MARTATMKALKQGTQAAHASIEAIPITQALANGALSRTQYRGILTAYLALHQSLARALQNIHARDEAQAEAEADANAAASAAPAAAAIEPSILHGIDTRIEWLIDDLHTLALAGENTSAMRQTCHLRVATAFEHAIENFDDAELLGVAYVLEGAALGNAFLYPKLRETLALADNESSYFRGRGIGTMHAFQAFGEALNAHVPPDREHACVAAACTAFAYFERALNEVDIKTRETMRPARASFAPAALSAMASAHP